MLPREGEFARKTGRTLEAVQGKLRKLALAAVNPDASQWASGYQALPLTFVHSPTSFLCSALGSLVEQNLAFFAETADENGLWPVTWQWAAYPQEFAVAKRWWQGIIALERYRIFQAFAWL